MKLNKKIYITSGALLVVIMLIISYCILCLTGVITLRETNILISSANASFEYDGTNHNKEEYTLEYGALKEDERFEVSFVSRIKDVGTCDNVITVKVLNSKNADVTNKYNIKTVYGKLKVVPREITIKTSTNYKEYDGTSLSGDSYQIVTGSLVEGQRIEVSYTSKISDVGSTYNIIDTNIFEAGENITHNYDITYDFGSLTVMPTDLVLKSSSATKEYDGTRLISRSYEIVDGALGASDIIVANYSGQITNVGTELNTFSVDIIDKDGKSKLESYNITYIYGTLNVYEREVFVKTDSASKVYDGTPLKCNSYECLTPDKILSGDYLVGECVGSQLNADSSPNYFVGNINNAVNIQNSNYKITTIEGTLSVTKRPISIIGLPCSKEYDGYSLSFSEYELVGSLALNDELNVTSLASVLVASKIDNNLVANVFNGTKDVSTNYEISIYNSTLEITKRKITVSSSSDEIVYDGKEHMFTSVSVSDGSVTLFDTIKYLNFKAFSECGEYDNTFDVEITNHGVSYIDNYDIEYIYGNILVNKREITFSSNNIQAYYKGKISQRVVSVKKGVIPDGFAYEYTLDSISLETGSYRNSYTVSIYDSNGINKSDSFIISTLFGIIDIKKIPYAIKSASITRPYEANASGLLIHEYENISGTLYDGDSIYVYYKSVLYYPGQIDNVIDAIIFDVDGNNVTNNYDLDIEYGTLTYSVPVTSSALIVYPESLYFEYDGTFKSFDPSTNKINGLTELLNEGYTYDVAVAGMGKSLGTYETEITSFHLYLDDVDVTSFFEISYSKGTIQIYQAELNLSTLSLVKEEYDGIPLTSTSYTLEGNLDSNHQFIVTKYQELNNVGKITNSLSYIIIDINTYEDVGYLYKVNTSYGTLEIKNKHHVSVLVDENSIDDNLNVDINVTGLLNNHYVYSFDVVKDITIQQEKEVITITITNIKIYDQNGQDVTNNYIVYTEEYIFIR